MFPRNPELIGLLIGLADALPRWLASRWYAPGDGQLHGMLVVANVHHRNETLSIGLTTMQGFALAAVVLVVYYAATRAAAHCLGPALPGFRAARACLAVVAGVLLLNALESAWTGKVTDYIGLARGSRVWMLNLGDLALWAALAAYLPLLAWASWSGWSAARRGLA